MIRRKTVGWGSLGALEKARRAHADTWERVRRTVEDGAMGRRKAEEERQSAATLVQQAWSGGYKRACEIGGAVFVPMAMTPYGGWHREDKDLAESWTRRTTHTGDNVGYYELRVRPTVRTSGANLGERGAPRFLICVRWSGNGE